MSSSAVSEPAPAIAAPAAVAAPAKKRRSFLRTLLASVVVWYLYVVHIPLLRLLGPWIAVRITRAMAWLHWLLTFAGAQRNAYTAISILLPQLETNLSARTILRKHLETKHHMWVLWHLCTTERGRRYVRRGCEAYLGRAIADEARASSHGLIIAAYHFGIGRLIAVTMTALYPQDEIHEPSHAADTHSQSTFGWAARAAHNAMNYAEHNAGLRTLEIFPNKPPIGILRQLRKGNVVTLTGDGAMASEFMEVPFLGGTIRLATGIPRLAAVTGDPIVAFFGTFRSLSTHVIEAHGPIYCKEDTPEAYRETLRQCVAILEQRIKREPWAWWIWPRLRFEYDATGQPHIKAEAVVYG